ncbi:unnamed protein product [Prorocentrum cordatum]|uniref:Ammonium transporter AmtB-like domain-containing protein n=1 Tax=Prorocentrum cordatum TaxID=2364126 RepID=A0ABN9T1D5_9DINO|nr:unnamed protein product [Polarella glacialis]
MAERTHMTAYLTFATLMAGVVYPIVADSAWGDGALAREFHGRWHEGYDNHDFAGSGVVHFLGGTSALVGNLMLGRRIMRPENGGILPGLEQRARSPAHTPTRSYASGDYYRKSGAGTPSPAATSGPPITDHDASVAMELQDLAEQDQEEKDLLMPAGGWPRRFDNSGRDEVEFEPITYLQVAGMFTLWVGWYGFNSGSTLALDRQATLAASIIAWNTTVAAASGGFGAYLYCLIFRKRLDLGCMCNGVLTGLVSITASCDVATPGAASTVGFVGGLVVFPLGSHCMKTMHLDDPVDAVSLHMFGGFFGLLATAFCRPDCEMLAHFGGGHPSQAQFCREGHDIGRQMVAQLWGALTELVISGGSFALVWGFFAVSERTRAHEVEHLAKAEQLLHQMVTPDPQEGAAAEWEHIVRRSPLARRILHRHGLARGCFPQGAPDDLWRLRRELRQARGGKAETALEKQGLAACLARAASRCRPLRELALLRLRISPAAELSGLGIAEADGGRLFGAVRDVLHQVAAARDAEHSPLKREVRELILQVRSQEAILAGLSRSSRFSSWRRRRLQSVPERTEGQGGSSSRESSAERQREQAAAAEAPPPVEAPDAGTSVTSLVVPPTREPHDHERVGPSVLGRSMAHYSSGSSSSTNETQRDSALSYNSTTESTPPPSGVGRRPPAAAPRRYPHPAAAPPQAHDAATHELLVNMLEAQTHLLSALHAVPLGGHVGAPPRAAPAGAHGVPAGARPAFDAQRLVELLQAASLEERDRLSSGSPSIPS